MVLPAVMVVENEVFCPEESKTVRMALKRPALVYVWLGLASVEIAEPSPKSHSNRIESPGSASLEFEPVNCTVSGSAPSVLSVDSTAFGARLPLT